MKDCSLLTPAEQQVMLHLWQQTDGGGFVNDILQAFEPPRPAYTTVATFLRILARKGFVKSVKTGGMLYFTPRISQQQYLDLQLAKLCDDFFHGDAQEMRRYVEQKSTREK